MTGCKYTYSGPSPMLPRNSDSPTIWPTSGKDRGLRTIPLQQMSVFEETFLPGASKNSMRLMYYKYPQVVAINFPFQWRKGRISCLAIHTTMFREENTLKVTMPLGKCRFVENWVTDKSDDYTHSQDIMEWVYEEEVEMFKGERAITFVCTVLGNSREDQGSAVRLAHVFAELVVDMSSKPKPTKYQNPMDVVVYGGQRKSGNTGGHGNGESGKRKGNSAYEKNWRRS